MIRTRKCTDPKSGIRLLKYVVEMDDVIVHAGLACGPAPLCGNRVMWSLSFSARADYEFTPRAIQQIKRALLPHVPLVICGYGRTEDGRQIYSLAQSDAAQFAGN